MTSILNTYTYTESKDTRSGFGDAMTELGAENEKVVALCADLTGSLKLNAFEKAYPSRFIQTGIAEANMIGMAAGLAIAGYIPYATTFANFATGRVYDQIRQSVAYSHTNVKICASHAGITLGEDGATHQILEDLGMMRMLPGMTVINTCDYNQTFVATKAIANHQGPVYLRFGRPVLPIFTSKNQGFQIGKAIKMHDGADITIIATGHLVWEAIQAIAILQDQGISAELLNIHTIKPLDEEAIAKSVAKTGCAVTAEEHNVFGGLFEAVAGWAIRNSRVPIVPIAVQDTFGESGTPDALMAKYGLKSGNIVEAVKLAISKKNL